MSQSPSPTAASQDVVAQATADLAAKLGVSEDDIEVVSVEQVTWTDGSLGCPKPGMMYTQALVEGTKIVLRVDGQDYEYHAGAGKAPFLCEHPTPPANY